MRRRNSSAASPNKVALLTRKLDEAHQQQATTADVLKVISRSTFDLQAVLETLTKSAARLCEAEMATIARQKGDAYYYATTYGFPKAANEYLRSVPLTPGRGSAIGRSIVEGKTVQIPDALADPEYMMLEMQQKAGFRTVLGVPLLRKGRPIGVIGLLRSKVRPFTDKQIELVSTFADQAVIAIENVRLFEAEQQRTRELSESLEQQMATSDVLRVISSSPGELEPVFNAMLENAVRICGAGFGNLWLREGDSFCIAATHGAPAEYQDYLRRDPIVHPKRETALAQITTTKQAYQIADIAVAPTFGDNLRIATIKLAGARTLVGVPMLKDNEVIGVLAIYRQEARPFTDKQIELVTNFAAQAVIAIENTRLLNELRQRTTDLTDALEQQTATSEVLQVISRSPGDLELVFATMLENAVRICEAKFGNIYQWDGEASHLVATHNTPPAFADYRKRSPINTDSTVAGRMAKTKSVVHVADLAAEQAYADRIPGTVAAVELGGVRTFVSVPMLKENELIGSLALSRQDVRPFTDKQIALVTNFAAQAVIAIENARLLTELRQRTDDLGEALGQQTATADVLKVISRSTFDLRPVFEAMLDNAMRVCDAMGGGIYRWDGDALQLVAIKQAQPAFAEVVRRTPIHPNPKTNVGRMLATKTVVHVADLAAEPAYVEQREPGIVAAVEVGRVRTLLAVPMLRETELIGAVILVREEVRPFTDKQIELVQSFASQAVIAIENTRLLNELRQSLQQQTATADVLKIISRSTFDLQPVLDTLVESATRLCEAYDSVILLRDAERLRVRAHYGPIPVDFVDWPIGRGWVTGRAFIDHKPIHVHDLQAAVDEYPDGSAMAIRLGPRTVLATPLMREDEAIGALMVRRTEVRPFTDKQMELVTTFAAQAVIAIENARLLNELRESLQQQTATADVLKVISRSTFDLQTVLQTLVESAAHLCEADKATITRQRGEVFFRAEAYGFSSEFLDYVRSVPVVPERGSALGRALLEGKVVHIPDVQADPEYTFVEAQRLGDFRTVLGVPMLREGIPIGVLALTRSEVRPFTDKQIELVSTFADQAAIAIENVRLFESVEARTRELAKSLEDLRTAQDRLVQTEKLASLGQLTAGIAHEIKNPLNFVNNFSAVSVELVDELREALGGAQLEGKLRAEISEIADMLQGNLDKVVQHGKRADSIVKNMLLHSRQGSGEHRPVDINALVEESLNLAYHGARAEKQGFNITLKRSFDPAAGEVDLYPQEITRVLLNLISNGFYAATKRKAKANGGNYEPILAATTKNLGDRVEIKIRDNGTGIPPEVKEKMFNPFFTTKPVGEGTGLGLSISHDIIVKQHGGSIEVDTQPGEFTEFRIVLPRGAATIAKSGERP